LAWRNQGACGQRPEAAAYLLDFVLVQFASTLANQYSVLIIHVFLLSSLGPLSGPNLVKEVLLIGAAALAVEGISIESAGCSQRACGQCPKPTGHHCDFVLIQITSTLAKQYSVLIIHVVSFRHLGPLSGPNLVKEVLRRKRLHIGAATLAVEGISIECAGWGHAAFGRSPQPTGYHHDFLFSHVTSAPAS